MFAEMGRLEAVAERKTAKEAETIQAQKGMGEQGQSAALYEASPAQRDSVRARTVST